VSTGEAEGRVLALCGGVGGAKLALGLGALLPAGRLTIVVNTGDDFEHLGHTICPDLDTVTYTLASVVDREQGWGRANESWTALTELERHGGDTWFRLGDKDLGLHLMRRSLLDQGRSLSEVTAALSDSFGIRQAIVPMTNDKLRTYVETEQGILAFQHYFVRERCAPRVRRVIYAGAETAQPSPPFAEALSDPNLAAVIICPSNPYLSIDPILSLKGVSEQLQRLAVPVIAVSPIIGGEAVKGPTAKIMDELGLVPSAAAIARHYQDLLTGYVADPDDSAEVAATVPTLSLVGCNILMSSLASKVELARRCLHFAVELASRP